INTNQITGANLVDPANTEYGIVTDNTAIMVAAKYSWEPFRFYAGYEHIRYVNPSDPLGIGATAQGGYILSGVEDNNLDSPKTVHVWWTGVKYAFDSKTDLTLSYYHQQQNTFRVPPTCVPGNFRASCSGTLEEVSFFVDHHFTRRFDVYAGIAYSDVSGGLAIAIPHGPGVPYLAKDNVAPTIGGRFTF
ncbi:MAG TPA: porin, partial [Steroidobacteraceae bacterium]|nr:porin [Steroidobacteraceae bacterium]